MCRYFSPLLVDTKGGLHVISRDGQGEVAYGQVIPFHEWSPRRSVLRKNILDPLEAAQKCQITNDIVQAVGSCIVSEC